jgi:hypothetical protein
LEPGSNGRESIIHEGSHKGDVDGAFAQRRPAMAPQLHKAEESNGASEVGVEIGSPCYPVCGEGEAKVFVRGLKGERLVLQGEKRGISDVGDKGAFFDVEFHVVVVSPGGGNVQLLLEE